MKSLARIILVCSGLLASGAATAGDDISGSKDHPLLTRYPDSRITEYRKNYDSASMTVAGTDGKPSTQAVEGDMTFIRYFYRDASTQPSPLQLIRNYQNAIKTIQGTVVYERMPKDNDPGETTLKVHSGGKDIWIKVEPDIWSAPAQSYKLSIVEVAAMAQVVSANALLEALNKDGFIALYINFDTGKSDLKTDGTATVKEIVAMLKAAPALKIGIEGHTDNVGSAPANLKLSEARAKAVMDAVAASGIAKDRVTAKGLGQTVPIADNRSDEGRAKNRRVELVKR
jgi:OmpA-OmpF porin, OOP family